MADIFSPSRLGRIELQKRGSSISPTLARNVGALLELLDMTAEVWSHSDPELRASTEGWDVSFFTPFLRLSD